MKPEPSKSRIMSVGGRVLSWVEILGLVVIAIATVIAGGQEIMEMVERRAVNLGDLLLLFIYLEVLTMIGIYLQSGALPIRMPLYIAMVALARHLIIDMKEMTETAIIATSVAILILAVAVLLIRFGHVRFPYNAASRDEDAG
ncbi:phosphate-starvation-inducible PsiE family protein [Thiocapsa sp.]|uniref:phosphate-starvation-inducible protein PsiE n=1 Tax=Thiocapsa sp. TaxID=2024551 RepID=UPI002CC88114|nr:phosphate-starvation-inducible PsiE family protein [Thiocapsa sp.]HSO83081.1 phosphate-starvation-inducible PsiE family protein [Thiocapsa sp.]